MLRVCLISSLFFHSLSRSIFCLFSYVWFILKRWNHTKGSLHMKLQPKQSKIQTPLLHVSHAIWEKKQKKKRRKMSSVASNTKQYYRITSKAWAKTFIYGTFWTSIRRVVHIQPTHIHCMALFETKQQNVKNIKQHTTWLSVSLSLCVRLSNICSIHNPYAHVLPRVEWFESVICFYCFLLFLLHMYMCVFPLFYCIIFFFSFVIICLQLLCLQQFYISTFMHHTIQRLAQVSCRLHISIYFAFYFFFYDISNVPFHVKNFPH